MSSCLLSLGAFLAVAAPAPTPRDDTAGDQKKVQGTWRVVRLEDDGRPAPMPGGTSPVVTIARDRLVIKERGRQEEVTFTLDARKKPRHINLLPKAGKGKEILGIYKFERDNFVICFSHGGVGPRPKDFNTRGMKNCRVIVFERGKP
jgi:uncharacterized protein (TIGR03067 family)